MRINSCHAFIHSFPIDYPDRVKKEEWKATFHHISIHMHISYTSIHPSISILSLPPLRSLSIFTQLGFSRLVSFSMTSSHDHPLPPPAHLHIQHTLSLSACLSVSVSITFSLYHSTISTQLEKKNWKNWTASYCQLMPYCARVNAIDNSINNSNKI